MFLSCHYNIIFYQKSQYKNLGFFCFFSFLCMNLYPNPYSLWCSCENRHSYTSTHFCDVAKNVASEHHPIGYPYTRGSKKPSKKSAKKGVPASLDLRLLYRITFCEINKVLTRGNQTRFWRGQMANVHHSDLRFVIYNYICQKKHENQKKR